jgi:peroxiredoxin
MTINTFTEQLERLNAMTCDELPTPQMATLRRAISRLRRSGILECCMQKGETAPDFSYLDRNGNEGTLYRLLAKGPVVINFFRGFWCSYCKIELAAYEQVLPQILDAGASYLAVSPQQKLSPADFPDQYQLVCDCDNKIARAFGIAYELGADEKKLFTQWNLLLDEENQSDAWELPLPATYIIAQDHSISFQFTDADFRMRLAPDVIATLLLEERVNQ